MKKYLFFLHFFLFLSIYSQTIEDAWVYFRDKPQATNYLANPLNMLSQRALARRQRLHINLDQKDVPVDSNYILQIANANGITYQAKSKWLNAIHVQGLENDIRALTAFHFVDHIEFANKNLGIINRPEPNDIQQKPPQQKRISYDYGQASTQIDMLNGALLHQHNYTGQNVLLAVIDAGFKQVDTSAFFHHLFVGHKLIDTYNFVGRNPNVYQYHYHGTEVLSTIVAKSNGLFVGTAPDVSVALYISEDVTRETPLEESYWAEAAERADSIGVDVINTSLGYNIFDRPEYNYSQSDLDGQTAFISRAAEIAVSRGINVVVSAGNSGQNTQWPKIGFPADAQGVITVGAVDGNKVRAGFSSIGPTADGRIKPDVMAMGQGATVYYNNQILSNNGTSFSAPIMAGIVACMVQAMPDKQPAEIKQALITIADRYHNPDNYYGYGIPDFSRSPLINQNNALQAEVYPNPAHDFIYIKNNTSPMVKIYASDGKLVKQTKAVQNKIDIRFLAKGIYFMHTEQFVKPFIVE